MELLPDGRAHVILSDMAPNASGFREMDHEKLITMCLSLIDLAERLLQPGGSLLCKYWDGILAQKLQGKLSSVFGSVRTLKPNASRKDSSERYFLARMYRKPMRWRWLSFIFLICLRILKNVLDMFCWRSHKCLLSFWSVWGSSL